MQLSLEEIYYLEKVAKTASLVGIEGVAIDSELIRGISPVKTSLIIHNKDIPVFSFGSIALVRIPTFLARLKIASELDKFSIDVTQDKGETFAHTLTMKAKGMKVEFRCADPSTIHCPKQLNDVFENEVVITDGAISMMQKAMAATGAKVVNILSEDGETKFKMLDINGDEFVYAFGSSDTPFSFYYDTKVLLNLLKSGGEQITVNIGKKGPMLIPVNDINVFAYPQVTLRNSK